MTNEPDGELSELTLSLIKILVPIAGASLVVAALDFACIRQPEPDHGRVIKEAKERLDDLREKGEHQKIEDARKLLDKLREKGKHHERENPADG